MSWAMSLAMSWATSENLRKVLVIAAVELRRMFRDRSSIFFILIFPLVLVLAIGTVFGGGFEPGLGVVAPDSDPLAQDAVAALRASDEIEVHKYDSVEALRDAVERGSLQAGVVIPDDYGEVLASGEPTQVVFTTGPSGIGAPLRAVVDAALRDQAIEVQAAQFAAEQASSDFDAALDSAADLRSELPPVEVRTTVVGEALFPDSDDLGQFDAGASTQLLLFMFMAGLAGSAQLIDTRQLGVARRMLSTPTPAVVTLLGEAAGRFVVTGFQGAYIMGATFLAFGVDWGGPGGALAVALLFALVATGAAMLAGALFRNNQQAGSVSVMVALGLAALGGCMAPLAIFPPTMRTIAHATPHAWANDAFTELLEDDAGLVDVLPNLAVLAAFAVVLLTLGTHQLHRAITR